MPETEFISILGAGGTPDASGTKVWSKSLPEALPILGLSDIVIFPGTVTHLLVETAQSIRLIDDVVAGDRYLGLVLQRNPDIENPTPTDLHPCGCAGRVLKMLKFPDGSVRVAVEGLRRFRVLSYTSESPYLIAQTEKLKDVADVHLGSVGTDHGGARACYTEPFIDTQLDGRATGTGGDGGELAARTNA